MSSTHPRPDQNIQVRYRRGVYCRLLNANSFQLHIVRGSLVFKQIYVTMDNSCITMTVLILCNK